MELPMTSNYTISFVEQLTKWVEYFPSDSQKSESIVYLLVDRIICWLGMPEKLISDNGANLLSALMKMLEVMGHNYIVSSHHVRCTGAVLVGAWLDLFWG